MTSTSSSLLLDVSALRAAVAGGAAFTYRYFWRHRGGPTGGALWDGVFSQWWPGEFVVDEQRYASAEQVMMAGKARVFGDDEMLAAIMAERDPAKIKALGGRVRGFDEAHWTAARFEIVTLGNVAKFGHDAAHRAYLLGTGDDVLVEASPMDRIW